MGREQFRPCEKCGESKEAKETGWGWGKEGMLACKPLDSEKPVHP